MGSNMEDSFQSSHSQDFSARRSRMKALPRPVEDYQTALKELMDAATKASNLFDEIYSSCYESNSTESYLDPLTLSKSILPPDVVRSGQAYQKLVPESFQVIQKLADKVSACPFSQDQSDTTKHSDNATLCFHKPIDYGKFHFQSNLFDQSMYRILVLVHVLFSFLLCHFFFS